MDLVQTEKSILRDPVLSRLSLLAAEREIPLFLVGGYIRDLLLGRPSQDYDFSLPAEASPAIPLIEELFQLRFFKIGKEELGTETYRFIRDGLSIDLTLFQGSTIEEDLLRRDFTINAVAFSLRDRKFRWVERALEHIQERTIQTVTHRSIDDDPLRMLRAIRYLSTLQGFRIDPSVMEEISEKKNLIERIPGERIKAEIDKILLSGGRSGGMNLFFESGLLLSVFPEFKGLESLRQGDYHHLDALAHTLVTLEKLSWASEWLSSHKLVMDLGKDDQLSLSYAALFHDLGKQNTYARDEKGRIHFYNHESYSCLAAEGIMERLRFSGSARKKILRVIQNHMRIFTLPGSIAEPALKRMVHRMGDTTPYLVLLALADHEASRGERSLSSDEKVHVHCLKILDLYRTKEVVQPPALITGRDVMALGYPAGPKVGKILRAIKEQQIAGEIKTREEALKKLKQECE